MDKDCKHLFELRYGRWTCHGWSDACGRVAPACFIPVESAVTRKGMLDLLIGGYINA